MSGKDSVLYRSDVISWALLAVPGSNRIQMKMECSECELKPFLPVFWGGGRLGGFFPASFFGDNSISDLIKSKDITCTGLFSGVVYN